MDATLLAGLVVATVGLLATAGGVAVLAEELSVSSLIWLTTSRGAGSGPSADPQRVGVLLAGAGIMVQVCGAMVAIRPDYDLTAITFVVLAWTLLATATAAVRTTP